MSCPIPQGWTTIPLGELLTKKQMREVRVILDKPDDQQIGALKRYLNQHKKKLDAKGVVPEFLAYMLQHLHYEGKI